MKKFYSVSLHGNFANILHIEKKKAIFHILEEENVDIVHLSSFLENKHSFYIVIDAEEAIDDIITIPAVMKNHIVIKSFIIKRFKDILSSKQIFLNYHKISEDKDEATITYKVDAIYEKEYIKKLELIKDWQEIKSATVDKFALLSLSKECFKGVKDYGYFSIFTYGKKITILAIDEKGELLFERTSESMAGIDTSQYANITEEINQTIAYVKQQFRQVDFSTLVIGGSLALDDQAAEHLLFSTNMAIAVMYPNSFIKGLEAEEPQQYITTLGSFLVKKKDRFLPDKVYSLKEYALSINILLLFSFIVLLVTSYIAFERYINYADMLDTYENTKSRLERLVRDTETYSIDNLQKSYKHLQIAERFLRYHPSDDLVKLKPLIDLVVPVNYKFDKKNKELPSKNFSFIKQFTTLSALYNFEKNFLETFKKINKENTLTYNLHTDYSKLLFMIDISNVAVNTPNAAVNNRRRRR